MGFVGRMCPECHVREVIERFIGFRMILFIFFRVRMGKLQKRNQGFELQFWGLNALFQSMFKHVWVFYEVSRVAATTLESFTLKN